MPQNTWKKDPALVNCSENDRQLLSSCVDFAQRRMGTESWIALSKYHELGLFVRDWPEEAGHSWALTKSAMDPMLIGVSQLSLSQSKVNERLHMDEPLQGLKEAGEVAMLRLHNNYLESLKADSGTSSRMGVPTSGIRAEPSASKRPIAFSTNSTRKSKRKSDARTSQERDETPLKKRKKAKNTPAINVMNADPEPKTNGRKPDHELPSDSPLRSTCVVGTVSAKLSYTSAGQNISALFGREDNRLLRWQQRCLVSSRNALDLLHIQST